MELVFMGWIVNVWYKAKVCLEDRNMLSYDNVVEIINQNMNMFIITNFDLNRSSGVHYQRAEFIKIHSFFSVLWFLYKKFLKSQFSLNFSWEFSLTVSRSFIASKGASLPEHHRGELPNFFLAVYYESLSSCLCPYMDRAGFVKPYSIWLYLHLAVTYACCLLEGYIFSCFLALLKNSVVRKTDFSSK